MNTEIRRRIRAIKLRRTRALEVAKKEKFLGTALLVTVGYFFGELNVGEEPLIAFARAIKYQTLDDFNEDYAELLRRNSNRLRKRIADITSQLLHKFNLAKFHTSDGVGYDAMVKIADRLPKEWRNYISQAVAETTLKSQKQFKQHWSAIEKLAAAEELTGEQRALKRRAAAAERCARYDYDAEFVVSAGLASEKSAKQMCLESRKKEEMAERRIPLPAK